MTMLAKVSDFGNTTFPAQIRREIGLDRGEPVVVRVEDGEIRIRTVRDVMQRLQAQARALFASSGYSVDDFIRERHEEAAREGDGE